MVEDYNATHNEVNNKLGNFINRTLKFKGLTNIPEGNMDENIKALLERTYQDISFNMEKMEFREVTNIIINLLDRVNKYYDESTPWIAFKEDMNKFNDCIYTCSCVIANIANYIEPIMPETASKIRNYLNIDESSWEFVEATKNQELNNIEALFNRL